MLWPEGAEHRLASLGSYVEPRVDGELIQSLGVSSAGAYIAAVSQHILALFRTKPFAPVAIYPALTAPEEHFTAVTPSWGGSYLATSTTTASGDTGDVKFYAAKPVINIEEVLKISYPVIPGPGEAIGARELWLEHVHTLKLNTPVRAVVSTGPDTFAVVAAKYFQIWSPESETVIDCSFLGEGDEISDASSPRPGYLALRTSTSLLVILNITEEAPLTTMKVYEDIVHGDFNIRMDNWVFITTENKLLVGGVQLDVPAHNWTSVKWNVAGTVIAAGHSKGWTLISMLGCVLYDFSGGEATTNRVEWLSDSLAILAEGVVRVQPLLRWVLGTPPGRPVLHGSGRLLLYAVTHQVASGPWLTAPLPTWYMASNSPLSYVASSPDGRFVAIAGQLGIMYFSLATRQWRELGDRDSVVRGGMVWYGRRLIASTVSSIAGTLESVLRMWSPPSNSAGNPSASISRAEQVVATESLSSTPTLLSITGHLLGVLVGKRLRVYSLLHHDFDLLRELPLSKVISGTVRSLTVMDSKRILFLVDTSLVLLTVLDTEDADNGTARYKRQTLAEPIEWYFYQEADRQIWIWDGQEAVAMSVESPKAGESSIIATLSLDAYPVGASASRGALVVVESEPLPSYDGSFTTSKPSTSLEVYVPYLLEHAISRSDSDDALGYMRVNQLARRYVQLPYFGQVAEKILYRAISGIGSASLPQVISFFSEPLLAKYKLSSVAACARKVEVSLWDKLFDSVGSTPAEMFDEALASDNLEIAAEFLLVVQSKDPGNPNSERSKRLYRAAASKGKFRICRELCEFLVAIDTSGETLHEFWEAVKLTSGSSKDLESSSAALDGSPVNLADIGSQPT